MEPGDGELVGYKEVQFVAVSTLSAWSVAEGDFPVDGSVSEQARFLVQYAVLAPSGHNTQPWLFKVSNDRIELYADRTRALPVVDPDDRELIISCGAALFHLRLALRYFGFADRVETFPQTDNRDLLARVCPGEHRVCTETEQQLFAAIPCRRTHRQGFDSRNVPEALVAVLHEAAAEEGAWLQLVQGDTARQAVADLIAEGNRMQAADPRFRRELAAWIRSNSTQSRDGMPAYAHGVGDLLSYLSSFFIRTFDWGAGIAARDRRLATEAPVLAVIGTESDTPADWLAAGQALAHVLLYARAHDVWASFLNQPIEVAALRPRLHSILNRSGWAQLLVRMGYGKEVRPTPRRMASEVLL